jgi:hypothetical protein
MEWQCWHWVALIVLLLALSWLPGLIAKRRGHPNATAIRVCGFVGVIIWPCWIVAIIWAYTGPDRRKADLQTDPRDPAYHYGTPRPVPPEEVPQARSRQERQTRQDAL